MPHPKHRRRISMNQRTAMKLAKSKQKEYAKRLKKLRPSRCC